MKYCLVDLCGTIVREDTTLGFIRHYLKSTRPFSFSFFLFLSLTSRFSPLYCIFLVLEKLFRFQILKRLAVRFFAGASVESVNYHASVYASVLIPDRVIPDVWKVLCAESLDQQLVLCSASVEPIVAAVASRINVPYVGSRLQQENGRLTGRFAYDLTGCKHLALESKYGHLFLEDLACVITDNLTDHALVASSPRAFVVLHRSTHLNRWQDVSASFIHLYS